MISIGAPRSSGVGARLISFVVSNWYHSPLPAQFKGRWSGLEPHRCIKTLPHRFGLEPQVSVDFLQDFLYL